MTQTTTYRPHYRVEIVGQVWPAYGGYDRDAAVSALAECMRNDTAAYVIARDPESNYDGAASRHITALAKLARRSR